MTEIIFLVEDNPDGGYVARALGETSTHQSASTTPSRIWNNQIRKESGLRGFDVSTGASTALDLLQKSKLPPLVPPH